MSDFVAGFSSRQNAAAAALQQAFAPPGGFAPSGMPGLNIDLGSGPISFRPQAPTGGLGATAADDVAPGQPRHFHPASRDHDPTQGWDPFAACEDVAEPAIDPLAAAHASGHAEGYAEGLAAAQRQFQAQAEADVRDGHMVTSIAEALNARIDRQAMAEQLRQTVLMLVGKLVGEIGVDADRLAGRIEAAIDLLSDAKEAAMLRVHPDDVAMLTERLPQTVFPVGDPNVERGGFVLESASTIVEDGPSLWLDQLAAAIDKVPVPQC